MWLPNLSHSQAQPYNKQAPSAQGLLAWWRGTPGFTDGPRYYDVLGLSHSTLGNMGTAGTTSGWAAGTLPGNSLRELRFDGVNNYVTATTSRLNFVASGRYTWTFWVYPKNTTTQWHSLWSQYITAGVTPLLLVYMHSTADPDAGPVTSGVSFGIYTSSGNLIWTHTTNNAVAVGKWYHITLTYDGSLANTDKMKIFVNGVNLTSPDVSISGTLGNAAFTKADMGRDSYGDPFYNGSVADVRVYNRALTPSEIVRSWRQGLLGEPELFPPPPTSLYAEEAYEPVLGSAGGRPDAGVNFGAPTARGLVSWWRGLQGFTGGVYLYDLMGGPALTLTNMGAGSGWATTTRQGGGTEIRFDGSDDRLATPTGSATFPSSFTLTLWMKATAAFAADYSLLWEAVGGSGSLFVTPTGRLATYTGAALIDPGNTTLAQQTWYHIGLVVVGNTSVQLYVNCVPDGTTGSPGALPAAAFQHTFGSKSPAASRFTGMVDDIKFYNRGLNPSEVCTVMRESTLGEPTLLRSPLTTTGLPGVVVTGAKGGFGPFFQSP